jgi:hypothetical protein
VAVRNGQLVPVLRGDGFRGSGRNYWRTAGEFIHLVDVQGSQSGGRCAVNLGIHLTFLPVVGGDAVPEPRRLREVDCEFRTRLAPAGRSDCWWRYGADAGEAEEQVRDLVGLYCSVGRPHFDRARSFPEPFRSITIEQLEAGDLARFPGRTSLVRACLVQARVAAHCGRPVEAAEFARFGLSRTETSPGIALDLQALTRLGERS